MAGIIGNMTAQARLRRGRKEITSGKCVYTLDPFTELGFRPEVHNKYVRLRASLARADTGQNQAQEQSNTAVQAAVKEIFAFVRICVLSF